jgi:hypothetical protein
MSAALTDYWQEFINQMVESGRTPKPLAGSLRGRS